MPSDSAPVVTGDLYPAGMSVQRSLITLHLGNEPPEGLLKIG
jgi:hypothetical protein